MSNVAVLPSPHVREVAIRAVQTALPACAQAAAAQVGLAGVQAFFNGYKSQPDAARMAA